MPEDRCIFPHSNNSIFSPTRTFPWHEERFGNHDLHTRLWKIFDELEKKECDKKKFQLTFKEVVKKILVGRQINLGIQVPILCFYKKNILYFHFNVVLVNIINF